MAAQFAHAQLMDARYLTVTPPVTVEEKPDLAGGEPSSDVVAEEMGGYYVKKNIKDAQEDIYPSEDASPKKKKITNSKIKQKRNVSTEQENSSATQSTAVNSNAANDEQKNGQGFGEKVKDMFLGGDPEKIEQQRSFLEKNDIRKNLFDLSVGTFYFYNHSQSNYYYRNYLSASPGAFVNLDLWVTPYLGFDASYRFTLLNSVKDSPFTESYVAGNHDWLSFGLKFRRFFGLAEESSSFTIALNYVDKKFDTPTNSSYRIKNRYRAPEIAIALSTPSSKQFNWNFGISMQPYVMHDELYTTTNVSTGASNQTLNFGVNLGGEYKMTRSMRTFFKFSAELYRSQFSGNTLASDPITNTSPTNVVVNDVYYFFNIGLIFGR